MNKIIHFNKRTRKDVLIISKKWSTNRGWFTSVERFCAMLDPNFTSYHGERQIIHPGISRFFKENTNSISSPTFGYSAPYTSFSFELELWSIKKALLHRPQVVFFPYADYDYYYFRYVKRLVGVKTVLWSFFSEKELQNRFKNLQHFANADLILTAGKEQAQYLSRHLSRTRVEYFPIGVDTDFFRPNRCDEDHTPLRLVHVGANRRDFVTLINGLDQIWKEYPDLQVDLIGVHTIKDTIPERPYLRVHGFLTDEQYLAVLQNSSIGLLCLEDGGSSNSLLEMMACGLPVVVTNLDNVRGYFDENSCFSIPKGDEFALSNAIRQLLNNKSLLVQMGNIARKQSDKYSWKLLLQEFQGKVDALIQNEHVV